MKSKEAIRNKIIHYANIVWGTKNINNLNSLIHLMIEEVCNELYLLDNKLHDIDTTILEKLVKNLAPSMYNYVRPAHSILHIKPASPVYRLNKNTNFTLKALPHELKSKNIVSVAFTPVIDLTLSDVSITNFFHNQTLWSVDENGAKSILAHSNKKATHNTVWIKLEAGSGVKSFKDLFFYIDFPDLSDNDIYYELLSTIKWSIGDKPLKLKQGLPYDPQSISSTIEGDILDFYEDHYQTIDDVVYLSDIPLVNFPKELSGLLETDIVASIIPGHWFSINFPPHFSQNDIDKMLIMLNAFPVLNRHYNEYKAQEQKLTDVISLPSGIGEEFLEMDMVIDSANIIYLHQDIAENDRRGTYSIEPIRKKAIEDPRISDYLEKLIDVVQDERTSFPEINNEKIVEVLNSISAVQNKETQKTELNELNEYAEVGRFTVNRFESTTAMSIHYWTTHVDKVNGIDKNTALTADKIPDLNKSDAIFITSVSGGKSFFDIESLKAINRFFLTSKDRVLTKHSILSFCRIELGKYIEDIDVVRKAKISPKFKEGIVNVMEIQINPKKEYLEYLNQKGVLKDLLIRLKKRSPNNFNYKVKLMVDL